MRKLLLPFLFLLVACGSPESDKKNENSDYLVSMDGIGPVKTGMSQEELEKLLNKPIPLTNPQDTISGSWTDSAKVQYKEAELNLTFVRTYTMADSFYMRVTRIATGSPMCKTGKGIGIGSSKQQIIDAFEDNLLIMGFGYDNDTDTVRSKSLYTITVREDYEGYELVFKLKNNKVFSMEAGVFYDDEE